MNDQDHQQDGPTDHQQFDPEEGAIHVGMSQQEIEEAWIGFMEQDKTDLAAALVNFQNSLGPVFQSLLLSRQYRHWLENIIIHFVEATAAFEAMYEQRDEVSRQDMIGICARIYQSTTNLHTAKERIVESRQFHGMHQLQQGETPTEQGQPEGTPPAEGGSENVAGNGLASTRQFDIRDFFRPQQ